MVEDRGLVAKIAVATRSPSISQPMSEPIASLVNIDIPQRELGADEAHIWRLPRDVDESALARLSEFLSPDESARAARLLSETIRRRFQAGRGLLRSILGMYHGVSPGSLRFCYGPNGKPGLIFDQSPSQMRTPGALHFNLAHSEGVGLLAITQAGPVGVDIEQIRRLENFEGLVKQFFSPREAAAFSRLAPAEQPLAFFNLWTRKEALLKATGLGIGSLLHKVEVTFLPGEPASVLSLPAEHWSGCEWDLADLPLPPGYVGALALPARNLRAVELHWS